MCISTGRYEGSNIWERNPSRSASFSQNITTGHTENNSICTSSNVCFLICTSSFKETKFSSSRKSCAPYGCNAVHEVFAYTTVSWITPNLCPTIPKINTCFWAPTHTVQLYTVDSFRWQPPAPGQQNLCFLGAVSEWAVPLGFKEITIIVNRKVWSGLWSGPLLEINKK